MNLGNKGLWCLSIRTFKVLSNDYFQHLLTGLKLGMESLGNRKFVREKTQ
jgi:hypothetical protein